MKRVKDLFGLLISDENLGQAIDEVNRTHHWWADHRPNSCTAWVEETRQERIEELREIIVNGFEPKPPRVTERWDTSSQKWRKVSEPAQWPDQYVHHALIQVLQPVMMKGMDFYCCGSVRGRGPDRAQKAIKSWMAKDPKGTRDELSGDIYHFYQSLRPEVVMDRMRQLIKDRRVLDLIWRVIKDGILIGAYTSQWFANTVLQPLDRMIRESGLCSHYVRYMDNLTIFGRSKRALHRLKKRIAAWLQEHHLKLKGDWQVFPTAKKTARVLLAPPRNGYRRSKARLPDAAGYRYGRGYTLPRKKNLLRIKRAVARYRKRARQGRRVPAKMAAGLLSRLGQLKHCSNVNIYRNLFRGQHLVRELKAIVKKRKGELTWSMYLAQREEKRSSRQRALPTPT